MPEFVELSVRVLAPTPVVVKDEVSVKVPEPVTAIVAPPVVPARLITRSEIPAEEPV